MTTKQILLTAFVLSTIGNIALAMNHGKLAREKYPTGYLVTKAVGGIIGASATAGATFTLTQVASLTGSLFFRNEPKPISGLVALTIAVPSLYFGWMGGKSVSKSAWNATWNMKKLEY